MTDSYPVCIVCGKPGTVSRPDGKPAGVGPGFNHYCLDHTPKFKGKPEWKHGKKTYLKEREY